MANRNDTDDISGTSGTRFSRIGSASMTVGSLALDPKAQHDTLDFESRDELQSLVRRQLELIGEDPSRAGLVKTPERVAKSLAWLTRGYELDAADVVGDAVFEETHESMVLVRDIEMYSLGEHHMLP